jgi:Cache domain
MSDQKFLSLRLNLFLLSLALVSGLVFAYMYHQYRSYYIYHRNTIQQQAHVNVSDIAVTINNYLKNVVESAEHTVQEFTVKNISEQKLLDSFTAWVQEDPNISAIGIVFVPDISSGNGLKGFLLPNLDSKKIIQIEEVYNYTQAPWYISSLNRLQPTWSGPLLQERSGEQIIRLSVPLFLFNKMSQTQQVYAFLIIDFKIQFLNAFLEVAKTENAYQFLINSQGTFISYPIKEYVDEHKTLYEIARATGQKELRNIADAMLKQEKGISTLTNTTIKQNFAVAYLPIPIAKWSVAVVYDETLNQSQATEAYKLSIRLMLSLGAFILLFVLSTGITFFGISSVLLWSIIGLFSILCSLLLLFIWTADYSYNYDIVGEHQEIIYDKEFLQRFLRVNQKQRKISDRQATKIIKTGLFVESFTINDKGQVDLSGIAWQRYDKALLAKKHIDPQLLIPNVDSFVLSTAYTHHHDDQTICYWYFKIRTKEHFSYAKYPLDKHIVKLRLTYPKLDKALVLTPDFDSWHNGRIKLMNNKLISLADWDYSKSYFGYVLTDYPTNFGIDNNKVEKNFPLLNFNVLIKRKYVYPLISGFLPIFIVTIVLFSLLIITKSNEALTRIVSIISGIFFATVVAHQRLKSAIPLSSELNYLEYFYFFMYILILCVIFDLLLFVLGKDVPFIHNNDNRLVMFLYWPFVWTVFVGITLFSFY